MASSRWLEDAPAGTVHLRVARARPNDVGTGTARVGFDAFRRLGLAVGHVIELVGRRRTTAVTLRLPFEDRGLEVIRIDGIVRANAGTGIGDILEVRRAVVQEARGVTLAVISGASHQRELQEAVHRSLLGRVVNIGDLVSVTVLAPGGAVPEKGEVQVRVVATDPTGSVAVRAATDVDLLHQAAPLAFGQRGGVTYDDVGGLGDVVRQLREAVELPLARPELFQQLGIAPPRGILLYGAPGSGKSLLARAVASEAGAHLIVVEGTAGGEVRSRGVDVERTLLAAFERACHQTPAIVLLEDIDMLAPARSAGGDPRVTAQLIALLDAVGSRHDVAVIGTAHSPHDLDEALRRPGRFDREIAVGPLDHAGRREVLAIHTRGVPLAPDVNLDQLSAVTLGFGGADIALLVREAAIATVGRAAAAGSSSSAANFNDASAELLEVTGGEFLDALARVRPAAMREHLVQVPAVQWSDIGGLDEVKRALRDGVELPLEHADAFGRLGIRASKGFLLFGPPGTGKTLLARAVAHEAGANFIAVQPSDLLSKWYGESERRITELFARARSVAPAILFLDEIEALIPCRGATSGEPAVTDRLVNAFLMEIDGLDPLRGVVVVGATNRPQSVDPALLRPGRVDELLYVPAPNDAERRHILKVLTALVPLAVDVDLFALADRTAGYTGADLEGLVRRAGFRAFCEDEGARCVRMEHFEHALRDSRPSVTPEIEREYEDMLRTLNLPGGRPTTIGFSTQPRRRR